MEYVAIVTGLILLQLFWFSFLVGKARENTGAKAPTMSGPPEFERAFRVHQNTVEQLIIFLPALWMFAYFVRADVAAGLGVVFIIGRQVYKGAYMADPGKRSAGFGIGALAMMILLIGAIVGAIMNLL